MSKPCREPEMVSETFNRARSKLKLAQGYLESCVYHQQGCVPLVEEVVVVLMDAIKELDSVSGYVPDVRRNACIRL